MSGRLRILLVASELAPYARVGELGESVAGLSRSLRALGHDVRVVLPLHRQVDRVRFGLEPVASLCLHLGRSEASRNAGHEIWAGVLTPGAADHDRVFFLEHDELFDREGIYGPGGGEGFRDDPWRAAALSMGALQLAVDRDFRPDVLHLHDWFAAAGAAYWRDPRQRPRSGDQDPLRAAAAVLTVHDPAHQGRFAGSVREGIGLADPVAVPGCADVLAQEGDVNLLQAGIRLATRVIAPSRSASLDFLDAGGACGLGDAFQAAERRLVGIGDGIDEDLWNPETDPHIEARFARRNLLGKLRCKAALQAEFALEPRADLPLMVALGDPDLTEELALSLGTEPALQLVVPAPRATGRGADDDALLHRLLAGADLVLLARRRDPSGTLARQAMRYAGLPIGRATGGAADVIADLDEQPDHGTGFLFRVASFDAIREAIDRALRAWFERPAEVARARRRVMAVSSSWETAARAHEEIYRAALDERRRELALEEMGR